MYKLVGEQMKARAMALRRVVYQEASTWGVASKHIESLKSA
jgi:hypothetical protein